MDLTSSKVASDTGGGETMACRGDIRSGRLALKAAMLNTDEVSACRMTKASFSATMLGGFGGRPMGGLLISEARMLEQKN